MKLFHFPDHPNTITRLVVPSMRVWVQNAAKMSGAFRLALTVWCRYRGLQRSRNYHFFAEGIQISENLPRQSDRDEYTFSQWWSWYFFKLPRGGWKRNQQVSLLSSCIYCSIARHYAPRHWFPSGEPYLLVLTCSGTVGLSKLIQYIRRLQKSESMLFRWDDCALRCCALKWLSVNLILNWVI